MGKNSVSTGAEKVAFCGILNELNTICIAHAYLVASQWTWVQIQLLEFLPWQNFCRNSVVSN